MVGNGGAAAHAVVALRESGYDEEVHLFSDVAAPACNPMVTPYYVAGRAERDACFPYGADFGFYERHGVTLHMGSPVVAVDAEARTLTTGRGESLVYEACLVATGASAVAPPVPGIAGGSVHTLRTMEDADRLKVALGRRPRRAVVVGASMVGIKLVELFHEAGLETCLVDQTPHLFPLAASVDCAEVIEAYLTRRGVRLRLGVSLVAVEEKGDSVRVRLRPAGESAQAVTARASLGVDAEDAEDADLVAVAVGVRPNLDFIDAAQVALGQGILVDERMHTSVPGLYAAGDVAQAPNPGAGGHQIVGLWASACSQGRTAGRNMAGIPDRVPATVQHYLTRFLEAVFVGIGDPGCDGDVQTTCNLEGEVFSRLVCRDGEVVGVNLFNCCEPAGMLKQAVTRGRVRPGPSEAVAGRRHTALPWVQFFGEVLRLGDPGSGIDAILDAEA